MISETTESSDSEGNMGGEGVEGRRGRGRGRGRPSSVRRSRRTIRGVGIATIAEHEENLCHSQNQYKFVDICDY